MCGRYTLTSDAQALRHLMNETLPVSQDGGALSDSEIRRAVDAPHRRKYNIVPASFEPILLRDGDSVAVKNAHWWLLPSWAGKQVRWRISKTGERTFSWKGPPKSHFNSRWDTVANPANAYWHGLLENRRCLVPADGFMEWPDDELLSKGREKIPRLFFLKQRKPFFFAGLFDVAVDEENNPFLSYNIITTVPNEMLRALPHHRMPAILREEDVASWIDPAVKAEAAAALLRPTADDRMDGYFISNLVNSPGNESSRVLEPLGERNRQGNEDLFGGLF